MTFDSLSKALEGCFGKPISKLPKQIRQRVESEYYPLNWDELSIEQRRQYAEQRDCQHDPATEAEREHWFQFFAKKSAVEEEINRVEKLPASNIDQDEQKSAKLQKLKDQLHQLELIEKNARSDYSPSLTSNTCKTDFIPYLKAISRLRERISATPEEMAVWVWFGPNANGLAAFTNANELTPPPRFFYASFEAGDYVADLMATWFLMDDIQKFQPRDRYITGAALIERWGKHLGQQLHAFVYAKIAESRLLDVHPHVGSTQWSDSKSSAGRESALFAESEVRAIEEYDGIIPDKIAGESIARRRQRLTQKVQAEKAKGTKAFLQRVAAEEGISPSRLKQIISEPNSKMSEKGNATSNPWTGLAIKKASPSSKPRKSEV